MGLFGLGKQHMCFRDHSTLENVYGETALPVVTRSRSPDLRNAPWACEELEKLDY